MPCVQSAGPHGLSPASSLRPDSAVTISEIEPAPAKGVEAAAARAAKGKGIMRGVISKARPKPNPSPASARAAEQSCDTMQAGAHELARLGCPFLGLSC